MRDMKIDGVALHRDAQQEADLVVEPIARTLRGASAVGGRGGHVSHRQAGCAAPRRRRRGRPCGPASASGPSRAHRRGRETSSAKWMFCSDSRTDRPSFFSSTMVLAICSTITGATPSDGSSSSTSSGLPISVRATVSICCSPPLMWAPSRSGMSAEIGKEREQLLRRPGRRRPAVREACAAAGGRCRDSPARSDRRRCAGPPARSRGRGARSRTACSREMSCAEEAHRAAARCAISPISAFMVVDLPAPLRPISATTSPRPTSKRQVEQDLRGAVPGVERLAPSSIGVAHGVRLRAPRRRSCRCRDRPPAPAGCRGSPRRCRRRSARRAPAR